MLRWCKVGERGDAGGRSEAGGVVGATVAVESVGLPPVVVVVSLVLMASAEASSKGLGWPMARESLEAIMSCRLGSGTMALYDAV